MKKVLIASLLLLSLLSFNRGSTNIMKTQAITKGSLVISEVYGGGGATSPYNSDYIVIYNNSDDILNIDNCYIHYGAATLDLNINTKLSGNILPRSYYLIKEYGVTSGTPLPLPDVSGSINIATGYFKVALTLGAERPSGPNSDNVLDFLGTGTANAYEGSPGPSGSSNLSVQRKIDNGVALDTDNNENDFIVGAPRPYNSALSVAAKIMVEDNDGQCVTKYPIIKNLVTNLSEAQRHYFQNDEHELINNARARYNAWSAYHNDQNPYLASDLTNEVNGGDNRDKSIVAIIVIAVISLTTIIGLYLINKKKKE